ncbi:MAG: hypothetical protein GTN78_24910 [Gemmatimonadales bacterium]|nr:hypothetical protein [Gemmatimonadales bacterium]NIR03400.1 hypothetical protein [Gemmatimonadales bacterium]NIS67072.1 hypothetical protein [Gemmatimonadales bacterium]
MPNHPLTTPQPADRRFGGPAAHRSPAPPRRAVRRFGGLICSGKPVAGGQRTYRRTDGGAAVVVAAGDRRTARPPVRRPAVILAASLIAATAAPALAQYPDAWILPRGALRVSFEPRYVSFDQRFDPDGNAEALGTDFSDSAAGVRLVPTALGAESAIRSITGDGSYTMSAGAFRTTLDSDIRRFPFNFYLGISNRLTVTVSIPFVTTRAQADFVVDSAGANVGWNQAAPTAQGASAATQIQLLLSELEAGAAFVQTQIDAGQFGCPSSPQCDQARDLVARTLIMAGDLSALSGVSADGSTAAELPPFAPLASSSAGQAVLTAVQSINAELQSFGASPLTATLPLPGEPVTTEDVQTLFTEAAFGYLASPIELAKYRQKLGDAEVGVRWGLVQQPKLHTVLSATVRLPTGMRDLPEHFTDIGTGDRQTDLILGAEALWELGSVLAVAASASYTLQLGDELPRRVTSHDQPIVPASTEQVVSRNLGDVLVLSLFPSLKLNQAFSAYASAHYFHKSADRFAVAGSPVDPLGDETQMRSLSFGGGIFYRALRGATLPIEAGIDYRAAFRGSGGLTPKGRTVKIYLRLFYQLFGGPEPEEAETESN